MTDARWEIARVVWEGCQIDHATGLVRDDPRQIAHVVYAFLTSVGGIASVAALAKDAGLVSKSDESMVVDTRLIAALHHDLVRVKAERDEARAELTLWRTWKGDHES